MEDVHKVVLIISLLVYFVLLIAFIYGGSFAKAEAGKMLYTPHDHPFNQTYSSWAGQWWNWSLSIQQPHPRDNYSPDKCLLNQNNKFTTFLADGRDSDNVDQPEIRECKVPAGKALLVQIVGSGCSTVEGYKNDQELRKCAVWILPQATFTVEIDGKEVLNTIKNPSQKQTFYQEPYKVKLKYVPHNLYDYKPGTYDGMVAGYYAFIPPFSTPGKHELGVKEIDENCPEGRLNPACDKRNSSFKYELTVVNPQTLR